MSNTDVSRLLGEMWRSASPSEKKPYVEQEEIERAAYKEEIKQWRQKQAKLDAASRTSHQSVKQHAAAEKPSKKTKQQLPPARNHDHVRVFVEPSAPHAFAPHPYRAHPNNGNGLMDRRVFRPYSGGRPIEAPRMYKVEHQMIHPTYDHDEVIPPPPPPYQIQTDQPSFRGPKPSPTESRPFEAMSVDGPRGEGTMHTNQQQTPPPPPPQYRHTFHLPENHQQVTSLNNTGSDISQFEGFNIDGHFNSNGSFGDLDPPFNPRQQRPAASHYFPPESFYKYP